MFLDGVIGEAPQLALGLWILLAIVFLGAFGVGLYGVKDVLREEWEAYKADRAAATAGAPATRPFAQTEPTTNPAGASSRQQPA